MKLKLLLAAAIMTVVTAVSVSAMGTVTGESGMTTSAKEQTSMLAVSTTDTIDIEVANVNECLVLFSYKNGEKPSKDNIQFVKQYVPGEDGSVKASFQIRSIMAQEGSGKNENGLYCVQLVDGTGEKVTLYYKVGKPVSDTATGATYYQRIDFTNSAPADVNALKTSVAYKADFESAGGNVSEYGFKVKYGEKERIEKYTLLPEDVKIAGSFSFGLVIYDIPTANADAVIDAMVAEPFVNYAETNNN